MSMDSLSSINGMTMSLPITPRLRIKARDCGSQMFGKTAVKPVSFKLEWTFTLLNSQQLLLPAQDPHKTKSVSTLAWIRKEIMSPHSKLKIY